jgi:hypothetical protein
MKNRDMFVKKVHELIDRVGQLESDPYLEMIKGKNIAVVGPTPNGRDDGDKIDGFDLVIRVNTAVEYLPYSENIQKQMGSKLDIIYLVPSSDQYCLRNDNVWNNAKDVKCLRLVGNHKGGVPREGYDDRVNDYRGYFEGRGEDKLVYYSKETPVFLHNYMSDLKGHALLPRGGFLSTVDSLLHGANTVSLFNMTFYHGGTNIFREDSVQSFKPDQYHSGETVRWHDSEIEIKMLEVLKEEFPNKIFYDNLLVDVINSYKEKDVE